MNTGRHTREPHQPRGGDTPEIWHTPMNLYLAHFLRVSTSRKARDLAEDFAKTIKKEVRTVSLGKSLYWLIPCALIFAFHLGFTHGATATTIEEKLTQDKTTLEIQKLRKEISSIDSAPLYQVGPILIALIAAIVSFWSALQSQQSSAKAISAQEAASKSDRVSRLLSELGNESPAIRAATIQALGEYPSSIAYLINFIKHERDQSVLDTLYSTIALNKQKSIDLLCDLSIRLDNQKKLLAGRFLAQGVDADKTSELLDMPKSYLVRWRDSSFGKRHIESVRTRLEFSREQAIPQQNMDLVEEKDKAASTYRNLLSAVETTLKMMSRDGNPAIIREANFSGIILDDLIMTAWEFRNCILQDSSFRRITGHRLVFDNCLLDNTNFKESDIRDSRFTSCSANHCRFSGARMIRGNFRGLKAYSASFIAAKIHKADFSKARLVQSLFDSATGEEANFEDAVMMGAQVKQAVLPKANFRNSSLDGADFSGTKITQIELEGASTTGAKGLS
jgi:uncharacterized protein YjbI with pentapeptide repeats